MSSNSSNKARVIKLVLRNYLSNPEEKPALAALQLLESDASVFNPDESSEMLTQLNTRINTLQQSRDQFERSLGFQLAVVWANARVSSLDCIRQYGKQWLEKAIAVVNRGNEEAATLKHALTLTTLIFTAATRLPEFGRAVTQPLSVKYAQRLVDLVKQRRDVQIDAMHAASDHLITHPSSFRPQLNALNGVVTELLAHSPDSTNKKLVDAVTRLFSSSARAAGKANVSPTLKKLIESTLTSIDEDVGHLQGETWAYAKSSKGESINLGKIRAVTGDLLVDAPFLTRRIGVLFYAICSALTAKYDTFVSIPVGNIVSLCTRILHLTPATIKENSSKEEEVLRISSTVQLTSFACGLLSQLSTLVGVSLAPHTSTILNAVAFHLSSAEVNGQIKHSLLMLSSSLTATGAASSVDNAHMTRIAKCALGSLALAAPAKQTAMGGSNTKASGKASGKGKKRSRAQFEVDEAFSASVRMSAVDVKILLASLEFIKKALHTVPSLETLGLKIVVALALDQEWRGVMPSEAASQRVWKAVVGVIQSKRALTSPMSSWIVQVTGSSELLDAIIHPVAPPPVVHADIDDKRVNLKKELENIKLALGVVGGGEQGEQGEDEDEDEDQDEAMEKEEQEEQDEKDEKEKEEEKSVSQHNPTSTASANGQLDFAVAKDEPKTMEKITTARPPPIESTKSFSNPLPVMNKDKEGQESSDEEMPAISLD
ncbi:hypothetical protein E3P81_04008 [Wallemia ichthyophaga]|nr:hypothetical protein E3P97_04017 [Wallemia ichthyophaga]TIB27880.1 hypothetical protein E3P85_04001 [Wallemia ichthyophaga]TIB43425.1 hypothetical protein E3P82_04016 [Wallemia ichthyophaga]TIB45516.1 hypothetical protein E3P81_04008 [Wallemia ichthyophaga]TIB47522.1 hypothetical protein E3P80_04020 [Wallemia ichthyophaga]